MSYEMSCSTTSDSPAVPITCEQQMDLQFAEIKLKLDDLIYKEQVNQLRILGVESTLHTILNKVCYQRVCVSTSSQTEEQPAEDSYTLLKSSTNINGSSNSLQVEDNELNLEELQRIFEDIPSNLSSAGENGMSATNASSGQPFRRANNFKKSQSQQRVLYQCSHCKCKFSRKDEMVLHEQAHDYVKCDDCSRVFASRGNLAKHRRFCSGRQNEHLLDETNRTIKDEEDRLSSRAEKESPINHAVEVIATSSSSADENEMSVSDASSEQPFRRANDCKKSRSLPTNFYQCRHCECKFSHKDEMLLHERVHAYVKCEDCSRVLTSRGNLAKHRYFCSGRQKERLLLDETSRTIKEEENSLSSGAEKESPISHAVEVIATSSSSADENGMSASDASQEQPIHRKFSRKIWMSLPERTHVETSLQCDKCLRVFTNYANAVMHRRFCSYLPKEKRFSFVCSKCGKSFPNRETRKSHLECHKVRRLKCALCHMAFLRPSHLTRHMITHTGARPYCCKFCRKRFGTIEKSSHERIHVKPLKCDT